MPSLLGLAAVGLDQPGEGMPLCSSTRSPTSGYGSRAGTLYVGANCPSRPFLLASSSASSVRLRRSPVAASSRLAAASSGRCLALLLLHANETLSTERLIDELWGERRRRLLRRQCRSICPGCARRSRVRRAAVRPAWSRPVSTVTSWSSIPSASTSQRFERLVAEASSELAEAPGSAPLRRSRGAVVVARAAAGGPRRTSRSRQREIARLDELRVAALRAADRGRSWHSAPMPRSVAQLEALIGEHPYRERLRAQLMLGLYRSRPPGGGTEAYQDARRTLVETLGIEPGERLRELERAILAQDPGSTRRRPSRRQRPCGGDAPQRVRGPRARAGRAGRRTR